MIRYFRYLSLFVLLIVSIYSHAQELNATVSVKASEIQGNQQLFNTLEEQLRTFINDTKWTETEFRNNEKIECTFMFIINEMPSETSFKGELIVQSRRPIFNSTYSSPMLNFRDVDLAFDYIEHQQLEFNMNSLRGNLEATVAFYVYLILGLDFDSMSPLGGTSFYNQMQLLFNNVRSSGWSGWDSFANNRNKSGLVSAFNDSVFEAYRRMWYDYHRLGLDEMAENLEEGRQKIAESLPVLSLVYSARPNSALLTLFGEAKIDEVTAVLSKATNAQKQEAYSILQKIYPTRTAELNKLKK